MRGFCVECGKETDDLVKGMCTECFLKDRQLLSLPDHVDLFLCTNCGRYLWRGEWLKKGPEDMAAKAARAELTAVREAEYVDSEASVSYLDDRNLMVTMRCRIGIGDFEAEGIASTIVRVKNSVCKICSRRLGNYYESILQIRTNGKALPPHLQDEVLEKVENRVDLQGETDANAFITKMETVPGGVDVYLSLIALGKGISRYLADEYCAETDESAKLIGQTRDGLDMYRVSYLVRLPDFHVGDVVVYGGKHHLLSRVSGAGGKLVSLADFRETSVKRKDMPLLKVYCKSRDLEKAEVVSVSGGEAQIMDPRSYAVVDVLLPPGTELDGEVDVARIDDVLYYVPLLRVRYHGR